MTELKLRKAVGYDITIVTVVTVTRKEKFKGNEHLRSEIG